MDMPGKSKQWKGHESASKMKGKRERDVEERKKKGRQRGQAPSSEATCKHAQVILLLQQLPKL